MLLTMMNASVNAIISVSVNANINSVIDDGNNGGIVSIGFYKDCDASHANHNIFISI